ncbi:MAG: hypothetical protein K0Q94_3622 [Paenibacillus sp.]|jgi:hypothetical protein|nr:hypothetical protein [Paenibacillus sp.]
MQSLAAPFLKLNRLHPTDAPVKPFGVFRPGRDRFGFVTYEVPTGKEYSDRT